MLAPNAEQIEGAADTLIRGVSTGAVVYPFLTEFIKDSQLKELHSAIGAATAEKLGVIVASPGSDFEIGYELGLQTARMVLMQNRAIAISDIRPEDIL